jgi:peptide chain release factor 2
LRTVFDFPKLKANIEGLKNQTQEPGFWDNPARAAQAQKKLADLTNEVAFWEDMRKELDELLELESIGEGDRELETDIADRIKQLQKNYECEEFRLFLGGEHDKNDAYLTIYSGAGGLDAQDWTEMLLRMYERYFDKKGYEHSLNHISYGEGSGIKEASLEVRGLYAYGFLKGEAGVHRLVRISPYSAQKLRHTSFALVEAVPKLEKIKKEFAIPQDELRIDTYRASGPGGQNVNTRSTAVRITHLPTGTSASSQNERSQVQNREQAMALLHSKLYMLKIKKRAKELKELKGEDVSPEWGSQIRSYVLHPYKMVKDHRTEVETSDVERVLDGDLDNFIDAEVKQIK